MPIDLIRWPGHHYLIRAVRPIRSRSLEHVMKTAIHGILGLLVASVVAAAAPVPEPDYVAKKPKPDGRLIVVMETSLGTIKLELFREKAPITVKNFLKYVDN